MAVNLGNMPEMQDNRIVMITSPLKLHGFYAGRNCVTVQAVFLDDIGDG